MNIFEIELVNIVFILCPFLLYLFYVAYNQNILKKGNKLILELAIFSSLYFILKYGIMIDEIMPILIYNIPLLIAFWFKRNFSSVIVSIVLIGYYHVYFNFDLLSLILEYIFYFVMYLVFLNYKKKTYLLVNAFIISKTLMMLVQSKYIGVKLEEQFYIWVVNIVLFYLSSLLIVYLINKADDIIRYHMNYKKLKENEQLQLSLFKITHEIKNPIAVCKGYLDMFDVRNSEHSKKYIPIIKSEIERTLLLLQDFLAVSKIKIEKDILDVNLLIEDVVYNFKSIMNEKKIELKLELDDDLEILIDGDYNRLSQVLINVIKNSIEAITDNGVIKIDVIDNDDNVDIIITDNGVGIENIDKINEMFFTTKKRGTGLGVPLSNEIIKAHHGNMKYTSKVGEGTTVTITLPK